MSSSYFSKYRWPLIHCCCRAVRSAEQISMVLSKYSASARLWFCYHGFACRDDGGNCNAAVQTAGDLGEGMGGQGSWGVGVIGYWMEEVPHVAYQVRNLNSTGHNFRWFMPLCALYEPIKMRFNMVHRNDGLLFCVFHCTCSLRRRKSFSLLNACCRIIHSM